jgi:hypothetical protein
MSSDGGSSDYISAARSRSENTPEAGASSVDAEVKSASTPVDIKNLPLQQRRILVAAARMNCILLFEKYRDCLQNGSLKDRFGLCRETNSRHDDCLTRQQEILVEKGYLDAPDGTGEKRRIMDAADMQQRKEDLANGFTDNEA